MRSVYNEERSAPFVNPCARGYKMSLLIDQSPWASFRKTGFKKAELIRQRCCHPLLLFSALNGFWYGGRPYRSWSGTASRVLHRCAREISWTAELDIPVKILQDSNEGRIESHRKPMGVVGSLRPGIFADDRDLAYHPGHQGRQYSRQQAVSVYTVIDIVHD
jgi:hypothetical protein